MAIEDILPSLFAILLVWMLVRYATRGKTTTSGIRGVNRDMVDTVHAAFPDIPLANVVYSLSRTRSAQATSEEILERGFLSNPPPDFTIPASLLPAAPTSTAAPASSSSTAGPTSSKPNTITSLVDRFGLRDRLRHDSDAHSHSSPATVSSNAVGPGTSAAVSQVETPKGRGEEGKAWESTKEAREAELRKRKERMILEARKRMLEKQQQQQQQAQGQVQEPQPVSSVSAESAE